MHTKHQAEGWLTEMFSKWGSLLLFLNFQPNYIIIIRFIIQVIIK